MVTIVAMLALTLAAHAAPHLAIIGGETWVQPGFQTYYRDPTIAVPHGRSPAAQPSGRARSRTACVLPGSCRDPHHTTSGTRLGP
jgi:hypothetical protein